FSQSIAHLGVGLIGSFLLQEFGGEMNNSRDPVWWLDFGVEYLLPLSGTQTDSLGGTVSFDPQDKPVFAILGTSADFPVSQGTSLLGAFQLLYNVAASSGSKLFGARFFLHVAFNL